VRWDENPGGEGRGKKKKRSYVPWGGKQRRWDSRVEGRKATIGLTALSNELRVALLEGEKKDVLRLIGLVPAAARRTAPEKGKIVSLSIPRRT